MRTTSATAIIGTSCLVLSCGQAEGVDVESATTTAEPLLAGAPPPVVTNFGDPLPNLPSGLLTRFTTGAGVFAEVEDFADGLGPVFNGNSCGQCHASPALGGSSTLIETRFGTLDTTGAFNPLESLGGSLIQTTGTPTTPASCPVASIPGEHVPTPTATLVAGRRTTPLYGLGLVDAVPDATFEALALAQASGPDGVRGRPNHVLEIATGRTRVGKFGWKSQVPTLAQFAGDAYVNEMGITSPLFPQDNCPQGNCALRDCDGVPNPEDNGTDVAAFADFMTLLAPPPLHQLTGAAQAGQNFFENIGCANCHVANLTTGPNSIAALDRQTFHPYSDFLLHDMGSLGDTIVQGEADGHHMRTAPLWGVSAQPFFLHDGRATTLNAAILAHGGEATVARNRFAALSSMNQAKVIAFLNAL